MARRWVRDAGEGSVWLRRLYTSPEGRDLVAMDSRRRVFSGLLRRMLVLRDDVCSTPWCDGVIAHADHTRPVRDGGPTDLANGGGRCARCNYVKEAPGWSVRVTQPGPSPSFRSRPRSDAATGPTRHRSSAGAGSPSTRARGTPRATGPWSHLLATWSARPPRRSPDRSRDSTGSALERFLAALVPAA